MGGVPGHAQHVEKAVAVLRSGDAIRAVDDDEGRAGGAQALGAGGVSSYEACGSSVSGSALPADPSKVQSCLRENSRNSSESNSIALPLA